MTEQRATGDMVELAHTVALAAEVAAIKAAIKDLDGDHD